MELKNMLASRLLGWLDDWFLIVKQIKASIIRKLYMIFCFLQGR